jgi:hypothetical protein
MESHLSRQEIPDVSGEQRTLSEITKRIRKLRWVGMEDEAQRLQTQAGLLRRPVSGQRARSSGRY